MLTRQIIYTILGVPFEDLEFLTTQNAVRCNGSSTAREASSAAKYVPEAGPRVSAQR